MFLWSTKGLETLWQLFLRALVQKPLFCLQIDGAIYVVYDMGNNNHPIGDMDRKVNDGNYHVLRFTRIGQNSSIQIDGHPPISKHPPGRDTLNLQLTEWTNERPDEFIITLISWSLNEWTDKATSNSFCGIWFLHQTVAWPGFWNMGGGGEGHIDIFVWKVLSITKCRRDQLDGFEYLSFMH